jgi:hypothetical protein
MLLIVMLTAMLALRMVHDGEEAMDASDTAFNRGDVVTATEFARRAAISYVPGAPHVERAYGRMRAIASGAEAAGDYKLAEIAWQSVRGSALESRYWTTPHRADLEQANRSLARLVAGSASRPEQPRVEREAVALLTGEDPRRTLWPLLAGLGFGLVVLGFALLGWRGVAPDGTLVPRVIRLGGLVVAIGAGCWTLAILSG